MDPKRPQAVSGQSFARQVRERLSEVPGLEVTVRPVSLTVATGSSVFVEVDWTGGVGVLCEVVGHLDTVRVMDPHGEDVSVEVALSYIQGRASGLSGDQAWRHAYLPAPVRCWLAGEVAQIQTAYGAQMAITPTYRGDELLALTDPSGHGPTGTVRLTDVRDDGKALEFTVFLEASPPTKRRPRVHIYGIDVRDDAGALSVSTGGPWRPQQTDDGPALAPAIDRLVSGAVRARRAGIGPVWAAAPYGR